MAPKSSGLEPDAVRSKSFAIALRGYELEEVATFLQRAAATLEALRAGTADDATTPSLAAEEVRATEFTIGWRGSDREEVDDFLAELADELERLESDGPEPEPEKGLPGMRTTWRPTAYTEETKAAQASADRETRRQTLDPSRPLAKEPALAASAAAADVADGLTWDSDDPQSAAARNEAAEVFFSSPGDTKSRAAFGGMFADKESPVAASTNGHASDESASGAEEATSEAEDENRPKGPGPLASRIGDSQETPEVPAEPPVAPSGPAPSEEPPTASTAEAPPAKPLGSADSATGGAPVAHPRRDTGGMSAASEIAALLEQAQISADRIVADAEALAEEITSTANAEERAIRERIDLAEGKAESMLAEARESAEAEAAAQKALLEEDLAEARAQVSATIENAERLAEEAEKKAEGIVRSAELRSARLITEAEESTRAKLEKLLKVGRERLDVVHDAERDLRKRLTKAHESLGELLASEPPDVDFDLDLEIDFDEDTHEASTDGAQSDADESSAGPEKEPERV